MCTVRCVGSDCRRTQHSEQSMLPHHRITHNDVFFLLNLNLNIALARL